MKAVLIVVNTGMYAAGGLLYAGIRFADKSKLTDLGNIVDKPALIIFAVLLQLALWTAVIQRKPLRTYRFYPVHIMMVLMITILFSESFLVY